MRNACIESSVDSVRRDPPHYTFVSAESAAFPSVRCDLQSILLNYAMDSLLVDFYALLPEFAP
jgi:hypothetical protein